MEELIVSSAKLMEINAEEKVETDCKNVEENTQEMDAEENIPEETTEENIPEETTEENIPDETTEENDPEIGVKESNLEVTAKEDVVGESSIPIERAGFIKFRQIMNEHLNGEIVDAPDSVTQSVLTSYTLAGYLDHAIPLSKELIIMKLHRDCCTTLLDLLR